jgi:hypothetical protein
VVEAAAPKTKNFAFEAAFASSWYPASSFGYVLGEESSMEYTLDPIRNFGLSAIVNMKFYNKFKAHFDLKVDDPIMQKALQYIGYVNFNGMIVKYDHHAFSGDVKWKLAEGLSPFKDGKTSTNFNASWNTISLLYNIVEGWAQQGDATTGVVGFGLFYANASVPMEYRTSYMQDEESNPAYGYGWVTNNIFGITAIIDVMHTELNFLFPYPGLEGWYYLNGFFGIGGSEFDKKAIKKIEELYPFESGALDSYSNGVALFVRLHFITGLNKRWKIGNTAQIAFALGLDLKLDSLITMTQDLTYDFSANMGMVSFGPTARLTVRF